mmetsp:Transcript_50088/g.160344  ORF Transcript_50088/g.160344 Transcript_50088/m.160344 type:complete len:265 (+) Transcript_50088:1707-2501(+)
MSMRKKVTKVMKITKNIALEELEFSSSSMLLVTLTPGTSLNLPMSILCCMISTQPSPVMTTKSEKQAFPRLSKLMMELTHRKLAAMQSASDMTSPSRWRGTHATCPVVSLRSVEGALIVSQQNHPSTTKRCPGVSSHTCRTDAPDVMLSAATPAGSAGCTKTAPELHRKNAPANRSRLMIANTITMKMTMRDTERNEGIAAMSVLKARRACGRLEMARRGRSVLTMRMARRKLRLLPAPVTSRKMLTRLLTTTTVSRTFQPSRR